MARVLFAILVVWASLPPAVCLAVCEASASAQAESLPPCHRAAMPAPVEADTEGAPSCLHCETEGTLLVGAAAPEPGGLVALHALFAVPAMLSVQVSPRAVRFERAPPDRPHSPDPKRNLPLLA